MAGLHRGFGMAVLVQVLSSCAALRLTPVTGQDFAFRAAPPPDETGCANPALSARPLLSRRAVLLPLAVLPLRAAAAAAEGDSGDAPDAEDADAAKGLCKSGLFENFAQGTCTPVGNVYDAMARQKAAIAAQEEEEDDTDTEAFLRRTAAAAFESK